VIAFPAIATTAMPQLLSRFCRKHPGLYVSLNGVNSLHRMIEEIRDSNADFAIANVPTNANGIACEHLAHYPAVCVVQRSHRFTSMVPVPLSEIAKEHYVSLGADDDSQLVITRMFESLDLNLPLRAEVSLCASACAWVASAGGCTLVDPFTAGEWDVQLARLETEPVIRQDLWLLRPAAHPITRLVSLFLEDFHRYLARVLPSEKSSAQPLMPIGR